MFSLVGFFSDLLFYISIVIFIGCIAGLVWAEFKQSPKDHWKGGILIGFILFVTAFWIAPPSQPTPKANSQPSTESTSPQATNSDTSATTNSVTLETFVEAYNNSVSMRYGKESTMTNPKSTAAGVKVYTINVGTGSTAIINTAPDNKISTVTVTIQGKDGESFPSKAHKAWTAALLIALNPGISDDDVISLRAQLIDGQVLTRDNVSYSVQTSNKSAGFYQFIARRK